VTRVVCLGVHIIDILGRPVERIPEGQGSHSLDEIRMTVAGTAAGTAVDLAKLGADVIAMGAVGRDALGDFLLNRMAEYGIDIRSVVRKEGVQTSATILPIRPNGERPALHVVGANAELTLADIDWDIIASAQYLHLGGLLRLLQLDGEPAASILRFAREHRILTTVDVLGVNRSDSLEAMLPSLPYIDYFLPNLAEARRISGLDDPSAIAQFFLDRGVGCVLLKNGAAGSLIYTSHAHMHLPAIDVPIVDSTGCGDAYCAGFITGLSLGWDTVHAAQLGNAAAALVLTGLGSDAGIVDLDHTVQFMERSREPGDLLLAHEESS
jgi:sugar/nucleoside kinase (ribokinase family)